jgi:hypothetical protein
MEKFAIHAARPKSEFESPNTCSSSSATVDLSIQVAHQSCTEEFSDLIVLRAINRNYPLVLCCLDEIFSGFVLLNVTASWNEINEVSLAF